MKSKRCHFIFQFVAFGKSVKEPLKIILPLVELLAKGVASEITKILTENTSSLIKKDYL